MNGIRLRRFKPPAIALPSANAAPGSRFLVFVRAGRDSLHPHWLRQDPQRTWDLFVSYYGSEKDAPPPGDFVAIGGFNKYEHFQQLHAEHPHLFRGYDFIWLPDPDISVMPGDIDRMFRMARDLGLELCQPCLTPNSFASFRTMVHDPNYTFRRTNFVEVMCPLFSRAALDRCLHTFSRTRSTWGIDILWPLVLGDRARIGILDAVQVDHTKPIDVTGGAWYRKLRSLGIDAAAEMKALLASLGMSGFRVRTYHCRSIPAEGRTRIGALVSSTIASSVYWAKARYWRVRNVIARG